MKKLFIFLLCLFPLLCFPRARPVLDMAEDIGIEDAGSYYTAEDVEAALQEIGAGTITNPFYLRLDGTNSPTADIDWGAYDITNITDITGLGAISGFTSISGTTLTDGVASLNAGSLSSAVNGTFSGTVQGGQIKGLSTSVAQLIAAYTDGVCQTTLTTDSNGYATLTPSGARTHIASSSLSLTGNNPIWLGGSHVRPLIMEANDDDLHISLHASGDFFIETSDWADLFTVRRTGTATLLSSLAIGGQFPGYILDVQKATDGGLTQINFCNSAASGSSDEGVGLRFRHTTGTTDFGGGIYSYRANDYTSTANSDADIRIYSASNDGYGGLITLLSNGFTGINDIGPDYWLEILGTTTQLCLTHTDGVDYVTHYVDDAGDYTIDASGGDIYMPDRVYLGTDNGSNYPGSLMLARYSAASPRAQLVCGLADNNEEVGFTLLTRGSGGNVVSNFSMDGSSGYVEFGQIYHDYDAPFKITHWISPQLEIVAVRADGDKMTFGVDGDGYGSINASGNQISFNDDIVSFASGGLILPRGTTPAPATEGAIYLDTDESANGSIMVYSNSAWRKVIDLP